MKRGGKMVRTYGLYLVLILCISFFLPRFLPGSPLSVLDEATASLDMKSEEQIQKEIERLASGRTTFIIAHRFSTIRMADRILVLEKGRVVADGTHEELMASSPLYRELYNKQQMVAEEEGGAPC